jgi:hypothetical protein
MAIAQRGNDTFVATNASISGQRIPRSIAAMNIEKPSAKGAPQSGGPIRKDPPGAIARATARETNKQLLTTVTVQVVKKCAVTKVRGAEIVITGSDTSN